jgi:hypothetical protein
MALVIPDPGDKYDKINLGVSWDFPEHNIPVHVIGRYPYKARSYKNAQKLAMIRTKIDVLCKNIIKARSEWEHSTNNQEYLDGVDVFLGLHRESYYDPYTLPDPFFEIAERGLPVSRYLLSEIPKGTAFSGLNKPKMRYTDKTLPPVGKDGNGRALYRDIFFDLSATNLKGLVIHELAHSLANHIAYRPDDHHADFKWAEKLIARHWPY